MKRLRKRATAPPPTPEAVRRRMLGQAVIDRVLQVSGPLVRPAGAKLETLVLDALARPTLSRTIERLADLHLPRPLMQRLIDAWIKAYDVDMSVAEIPAAGFETLDAFFTRRLVAGARPIDHDPDALVSPADSVLKSFGEVDARGRVPEVKGRSYDLGALLGDAAATTPFIGGHYGVFYLSPRDYHRVHAPIGGVVTRVDPIDGLRYPVNALGVRRVEGLFVKNRRTVFMLESEHGPIALVMVGATNVGRISASVQAGERIDRGQEIGIFHLGSTVVLVTPPGSGFRYERVHEGEWVRIGQAVMTRG